MEYSGARAERPFLSLHRTKMLLEHLQSYYQQNPDDINMTAPNASKKSEEYGAYLQQVYGFIDTVREHLEYNEMDVPREITEFLAKSKNMRQLFDKFDYSQVEKAKEVIAVALLAIKSLNH